MSWQLSTTASPDEVREKLQEAKEKNLELQPYDSYDDDVDAQIDAAIAAAGGLAKAIRQDSVTVSIAGHAKQDEGQTDSISASLYGTLPPPKPKK